jgi:hypothetical protein
VDDGFVCSEDKNDLKILERQLIEEFKNVEVKYGNNHDYLSMNLNFKDNGTCDVKMTNYIEKLIKENGIYAKAATPASNDIFQIDENSENLNIKEKEKFHTTVAQLLYLATRVRPDILLPTIFLTSRVQQPKVQDVKKLIRVLCYLNETRYMGITLGGDLNGNIKLYGAADAAFGVHPGKMRSQSGLLLSTGRGIILAKSMSQKITTRSSAEAELVALSDLSSLTVHQLEIMKSLDIDIQHAEIFQDNKSTICLATNGKSNSDKTKHIKIRYFFVKQFIDSGEIKITYCPTNLMVADILTKPLQGEQFKKFRDVLLGTLPISIN